MPFRFCASSDKNMSFSLLNSDPAYFKKLSTLDLSSGDLWYQFLIISNWGLLESGSYSELVIILKIRLFPVTAESDVLKSLKMLKSHIVLDPLAASSSIISFFVLKNGYKILESLSLSASIKMEFLG